MKLEEAVKVVEEKYKIEKYTPSHYMIYTNYMFNAFDLVTIHLMDYEGRVIVTDGGSSEQHSEKSEEEIQKLAKQYKFEYDVGYLMREFKSVNDITDLISLMDQIC